MQLSNWAFLPGQGQFLLEALAHQASENEKYLLVPDDHLRRLLYQALSKMHVIEVIIGPSSIFQITCYSHKDDNNKWLVKKAYEDYSEYRMKQFHSS